MPDPSKDFTPIQDEYEFFAERSTEAPADLDGYAGPIAALGPHDGPIRMLDFGCGPGAFTARFLDRFGWRGDRLDLALVEPSEAYRRRAVDRLEARTSRPIRARSELPAESVGEFDVILSNHVLYYVPELERTLGRIVGALAPDGVFVTAIAGRENVLVDFWFRGFPMIGRDVPYQTAEDVEAALSRLGRPFDRRAVQYDLIFPDSEENRLKILRFLFGANLAALPIDRLLALFDRHTTAGRIEIQTGNVQFHVR